MKKGKNRENRIQYNNGRRKGILTAEGTRKEIQEKGRNGRKEGDEEKSEEDEGEGTGETGASITYGRRRGILTAKGPRKGRQEKGRNRRKECHKEENGKWRRNNRGKKKTS